MDKTPVQVMATATHFHFSGAVVVRLGESCLVIFESRLRYKFIGTHTYVMQVTNLLMTDTDPFQDA